MNPSLQGQTVVIVGGTSGMGLGAARAAAQAGAEVIVAGRRPPAERHGLPAQHENVRHAVVDVTNDASVKTMFENLGQFDHLFVTASPSSSSRRFLEQDMAVAQSFLYGKFFGAWTCARYGAPKMRRQGSITFLTGATAVRPRTGASIVTAAFAAVEALSLALAVELGPLRVNTIRPGLIDSEMWNFLDAPAREQLRSNVREKFPVHRIGAVEDIGHAAVFLMTNPYVTGTVLEVTGGEQLVDSL